MPITLPQTPPGAVKSVTDFVASLPATSPLLAHMPRLRQGLSAAQVAQPPATTVSMPVYVLGVNDVLASPDLSRAQPASWTHVVSPRSSGTPTGHQPSVATVQTDARTSEVLSLFDRPAAFWSARDLLQGLPEVARAQYELAELRIPALHVEALLLRSHTSEPDLVAPFLSHADAVKVGRHYTLPDFLTALRPSAQSVSNMSTGQDTGVRAYRDQWKSPDRIKMLVKR